MNTEKYPFNYDAIQKGDSISVERLEEITKLDRNDARYALAVLNIKNRIEDELEARGRPVVACCEKGAIHVLLDEDATRYAGERFRSGLKVMRRAYVRTCVVDTANLSPEALKEHYRRHTIQGAVLQAVGRARRNAIAALDAPQRVTPGLPAASVQ